MLAITTSAGRSNRSDWTAPWVGGVSALMEKHFNDLGWAADAPGWSPMARLTAKPAYQAAMAPAWATSPSSPMRRPSLPIVQMRI
jgi:hypothetical protein